MNIGTVNRIDDRRTSYWEKKIDKKTTKQIAQIIVDFEKLASRDSLTSLINRREFYLEFSGFANGAARRGTKIFILYLDFDDLKLINDTKGHDKGDEMLKIGSNLLRSVFRTNDLISRFGGDEFVVAIEIGKTGKVDDIVQEVVQRVVGNFLQANIFISVGISEYKKGDDLDEVLKKAETAMKIDKKNRKAGREYIK